MNKRLIKIVCDLTVLEQKIRSHWLDILAIGLSILTIILMLLEFFGIIKL